MANTVLLAAIVGFFVFGIIRGVRPKTGSECQANSDGSSRFNRSSKCPGCA